MIPSRCRLSGNEEMIGENGIVEKTEMSIAVARSYGWWTL